MGRILLAFRIFFAVLFNAKMAERTLSLFRNAMLQNEEKSATDPTVPPAESRPSPKSVAKPVRSEALTLLEALQREARLIDLCQESLDTYADEQVGAAARNVLRDTSSVLKRFFALEAVVKGEEGATLEIPAGFDPNVYHLTGRVEGSPPYRGRLVHLGWKATRCELPQWSGGHEASLVIAAAEVEVQ